MLISLRRGEEEETCGRGSGMDSPQERREMRYTGDRCNEETMPQQETAALGGAKRGGCGNGDTSI